MEVSLLPAESLLVAPDQRLRSCTQGGLCLSSPVWTLALVQQFAWWLWRLWMMSDEFVAGEVKDFTLPILFFHVFSIVFSCFSIGFPSKPSWLKRWSIRSHGASTRHAQKRVKTRGAKCKGSTGPSFWHHFLQRQWHLRWGIYPGKEARDLDSPLFEAEGHGSSRHWDTFQVTASLQVQVVQFIPIPFVYSHFGQFWPILATGTAKCGMAGEWNFVTMVSVMRESGGMAFVRALEFLHVPIPNERHSLQKRPDVLCGLFFVIISYHIYIYTYIVIYIVIYIYV